MAEKTYLGLPRNEIRWYPKIDYDLCTNCGLCLEKCACKVYAKQGDKVVVAQPYECLVSCGNMWASLPGWSDQLPNSRRAKANAGNLKKEVRVWVAFMCC